MKKIMFNDRYGLTDAVLSGTKTVTMRVMNLQPQGHLCSTAYGYEDGHYTRFAEPYKVGEIVAVAQSYDKVGFFWDSIVSEQRDHRYARTHRGWSNKMFARADLMPHQIEIFDVRAERLQDITDEDCLKEGIEELPFGDSFGVHTGCYQLTRPTSREAYALLIDKINGRGTWERNPFVWRIEFKLVK